MKKNEVAYIQTFIDGQANEQLRRPTNSWTLNENTCNIFRTRKKKQEKKKNQNNKEKTKATQTNWLS